MLNSCQDFENHKDAVVVYEGFLCPLCQAIEDLNEDSEELEELRKELDRDAH